MPQMQRLFSVGYTLDEYGTHLARLFGFFEPLERAATDARSPLIERHLVRRAGSLHADLSAMGYASGDIAALERCSRLPPLDARGIHGFLYVMLGSMLGGRVIAQRLEAILGSAAALRFYGEGAGQSDLRWIEFCQDLEQHGRNDLEIACATANATFEALQTWLLRFEKPGGA